MTTATTTALGTGTWTIDPVHSTVGFSVRHLVVSKVRGTFDEFNGTITIGEDGTASVNAEIAVGSVNTRNEQRDAHLRSADFFDVGTTRSRPSRPPACGPTATAMRSTVSSRSRAVPGRSRWIWSSAAPTPEWATAR